MAMTKVKNLQIWCKKMADGYRDVEVRDMASSWKSGLAFCAIIHRFRPDLIDYDSLSKENIFDNNQLAFEVAEKQLNIPAFLEAADMVAIRVPDKLSIVTYVSQYYNYFHNKPQLGGPGVNKFNQSGKKKDTSQPVSKNLTPIKVNDGESKPQKERQESIGDKCTICHEKVYLLERHIENCKLYHRSCFRKSDLSPTSKVFKRHPSTAEEDKNDLLSNKHRKIDPAGDKTKNGTEDTGLDFWQRRAQQKAKQGDSRKPEPMETAENNDTTVNSSSVTSDTPSWKKDLEMRKKDGANKPVEIEVNNDFNVNSNTVANDKPSWKRDPEKRNNDKAGAGLGTPFQQSSEMKQEPKKSMGLADRFKKLDEQNLKNLGHGKDDHSADKQHGKTKFNDTKSESNVKDKGLGKSAEVPKAKPRQTVTNKFEEMETEPSDAVVPKPVPRVQKNEKDLKSPRAAPRKIDSKTKSPPLSKKQDLSRPKTPPQSQKTELTLNLPKNTEKSAKDESPSTPPPLPGSAPPKLPASQPPQLPSSVPPRTDTSPVLSARSKQSASKDTSSEKPATNFQVPPSKPPRASVDVDRLITGHGNESPAKSENITRSASPMTISGKQEAPKVSIKEPQVEHSAVLVTPKREEDEKKNRAVFGGLLKSLAGVRKNYEANSDSKVELNGTPSDVKSSETNVEMNGAKQNEVVSFTTKNEKRGKDNDIVKTDTKKISPEQRRPKSSFVSLTSNVFDNEPKESHVKVDITKKTTTTTTVVTFNKGDKAKDIKTEVVTTVTQEEDTVGIPEWKKKLDQRKNERARPKSADILSEKSNTEDIPLWKIEADRRKEARKGGYVDPEKAKVDQNVNAKTSQLPSSQNDQKFNLSRPLSPHRKTSQDTSDTFVPARAGQNVDVDKSKSPERRKIPFKDEKLSETSTPSEVSKKKITVDYKFKFEEVGQKKPPRPNVPPSPKSPKEQKSGPYRPPPPKGTEFQPTKHHISAYQIQKNLQLIDTKLTELEIKGRTLEDSIRKATDEEEDDLMIEWFGLVNQKNELVRTECDYIYVSRQQELEIEQHQIDQQLRYLVDKEDKTKEDLREEEYLMEKLVDVVNQRSKIVDSIDEDRLRYIEEDTLIEAILQQKAFSKQYKKSKKKTQKKLGYSKDCKNMMKKDKKKAR